MTRTDSMRKRTAKALDAIGARLAAIGVHPDLVTVFALIVIGIASLCIAAGNFLVGGILLLFSFPLDAIDGAIARAMQRQDAFGMVLDSTLDRYADGFVLAAFGFHFARQSRLDMLALAMLAMLGSFLVSYVRARADDPKVAVTVTIGLFSRLERVVVLLVMIWGMALTGESIFLELGLILLAIGTNISAIQRLFYVRRALRERESGKAP